MQATVKIKIDIQGIYVVSSLTFERKLGVWYAVETPDFFSTTYDPTDEAAVLKKIKEHRIHMRSIGIHVMGENLRAIVLPADQHMKSSTSILRSYYSPNFQTHDWIISADLLIPTPVGLEAPVTFMEENGVLMHGLDMETIRTWLHLSCLKPSLKPRGTTEELFMLCWIYFRFMHTNRADFDLRSLIQVHRRTPGGYVLSGAPIQHFPVSTMYRYTVWPIHIDILGEDMVSRGHHAVSMIHDSSTDTVTLADADSDDANAADLLGILRPHVQGKPAISGKYPRTRYQVRENDRGCGAWNILAALYFMNAPSRWPIDLASAYRTMQSFMTRFGLSLQQIELDVDRTYHAGLPLALTVLKQLHDENIEFDFPWD